MREIKTHKVNGVNDGVKIVAADAPGSGNAHHHYQVTFSTRVNDIRFQNGPIKEAGVNGLTHEVLLAIVADRLECFQTGPFACDENQESLGHVKAAMAILKSRTEKRLARGVEGTHQP